MVFDPARNQLSTARKSALDVLLAEWQANNGVPLRAATNLRAERGSGVGPLVTYLTSLADNQADLGVAPPGPKTAFEQIGNIFSLAGHEATPFKESLFGRAILLEKYARYYLTPELDKLGCLDTEEDIRLTLRAIADATETAVPVRFRIYFEAMRRALLGRKAVFATFTKSIQMGESPWTEPIPDAQSIRNNIALGEDPLDKDYILFVYRLPDGTLPRVPTTASPGWFYQRWFRPSQNADTELHGWTEPIGSGSSRPEIVHSEIAGTTLVFPIHIAKA
jgi:hypothetical protein